ncbi:hypothetical protein PA25_13880 [Pseudoalteromonas sp. A25]|uniref:S41 family peptidase n=1 Tax=Pseudoalteromonas sp. A25 TaxID=116092 RepID=UPI001260823D|nr:S41 family peptidase [Pseudoalteromonas sp. A25]BBN81403.1 hypothetical protein PA25_13880 [Pseudoalteromonas sp. A25]
MEKKLVTFALTMAVLSGCNALKLHKPDADAGKDQAPVEFGQIRLSGIAKDKDNNIKSTRWTQVSGPQTVTIKDDDQNNAWFEMPKFAGDYVFKFEVKDKANQSDSDEVKITINEKLANQANMVGAWHMPGYGRWAHFLGKDVVEYIATSEHCVARIRASYATYMQRLGFNFDNIEADWEVVDELAMNRVGVYRKSNVPTQCDPTNEPGYSNDAQLNFDFVWQSVDEFQGHLAKRGVDWQSQYELFSPQINAQDSIEKTLPIVAQMLSALNDFHSFILFDNVIVETGRKFSKLRSYLDTKHDISLPQLREQIDVLNPLHIDSSIETLYNRAIENYADENGLKSYTNESAMEAAGRALLKWGKTPSNMGLLIINQMDYLSNEEIDKQFSLIFEDLKQTDGLILDIRTNPGGSDDVALSIAGRFFDKTQVAFKKYAKNADGQSPTKEISVVVDESNSRYSKPVYLITSEDTISAAEVFTLAMRSLPNVIHIGEPTQGALSDVLPVVMPAGIMFGVSNETYVDLDGNEFEASGVPPKVVVSTFSLDAITQGRVLSYEQALQLAGK